jgi:hypothetical protein
VVASLTIVACGCASTATTPVSTGSPAGSLATSARSSDLAKAIEQTSEWEFLAVTGKENGSSGEVSTVVTINRTARTALLLERRTLADRKRRLVTEHILINPIVFVRSSISDQKPSAFSKSVHAPDEFSTVFSRLATLNGRSYASLSLIADLVSSVPYSAVSLKDMSIDGERCQGVRLDFRPIDIQNRLASRWKVFDNSHVVDDTMPATRFEIWTNKGGEARRIVETGTHFEDGEVILDVRAQLTFTHLSTAPSIAAPPI